MPVGASATNNVNNAHTVIVRVHFASYATLPGRIQRRNAEDTVELGASFFPCLRDLLKWSENPVHPGVVPPIKEVTTILSADEAGDPQAAADPLPLVTRGERA